MEDRENGAGTSLLQEYPFGNFECRGIKLSGPGTFSWFRNGEAFAFPPGMTRLAPCYTTEQFLGLPDTGTACGDKRMATPGIESGSLDGYRERQQLRVIPAAIAKASPPSLPTASLAYRHAERQQLGMPPTTLATTDVNILPGSLGRSIVHDAVSVLLLPVKAERPRITVQWLCIGNRIRCEYVARSGPLFRSLAFCFEDLSWQYDFACVIPFAYRQMLNNSAPTCLLAIILSRRTGGLPGPNIVLRNGAGFTVAPP
jgi:hypothetical protein